MIRELRIEEIKDGSTGVEVGRLVKGEVIIGRGPGCGIMLDNTAVSRQHGLFSRIRNHWLYKDLGSTNGSWLNGLPLPEGQWKLVRSGDLMQIADLPLRLRSKGGDAVEREAPASSSYGIRSMIVFANNNFLDEYPVPESGPILVIGGPRSDLRLKENDETEKGPFLTIERRDASMIVTGHSEVPIFINEEQCFESQPVGDRDFIRLAHYSILVNDPYES